MLYLSDVGVLYLVFTCACIDCNQGAAKVLIFPVVQQFTEAFVQALQMPDGPTSDSGFKMEVLKVSLKKERIEYQYTARCAGTRRNLSACHLS